MYQVNKLFIKLQYWLKFKLFAFTWCGVCGFPTKYPICNDCLDNISVIQANNIEFIDKSDNSSTNFAYLYKMPLKSMLLNYKYKRQEKLKWPLGYLLKLQLDKLNLPLDYIIPVPLHEKKLKQRGFNQCLRLLDYYVATNGNIPVKSNILIKSTYHLSQVKLNRQERIHNLHNSFKVIGDIKGKNILIVDDVHTTGATINEISNCLKYHGAKNVYFLVLLHNLK